jgi:hypothetical protein
MSAQPAHRATMSTSRAHHVVLRQRAIGAAKRTKPLLNAQRAPPTYGWPLAPGQLARRGRKPRKGAASTSVPMPRARKSQDVSAKVPPVRLAIAPIRAALLTTALPLVMPATSRAATRPVRRAVMMKGQIVLSGLSDRIDRKVHAKTRVPLACHAWASANVLRLRNRMPEATSRSGRSGRNVPSGPMVPAVSRRVLLAVRMAGAATGPIRAPKEHRGVVPVAAPAVLRVASLSPRA